MKEIIILVGPSGSGKSTYCSTILSSHYRISQDDMGKEGHWINFNKALSLGKSIVIDRMNFSKEQREKYLAPARLLNYQTKIVVFHISADTCFKRCEARLNHPTIKNSVDASRAIDMFFRKYERVSDNEADEVVRLGWDDSKDKCLVIDIDNTLSDCTHREHLLEESWKAFFSKLSDDPVNLWCQEIIYKFENDYKIVICSARPDNYKKETLNWLEKYNIQFNNFFMRRRGDYRKDNLVKQVILDFEIKSRYDVLFCVDDRKEVIDMYRANNIVVLDCKGNTF